MKFVVVGAGLTGAVIARTLADAGHDILVVEERQHVGGNCHDYVHNTGVRVNTHGPHYFRTNSEALWTYVQRFSEWRPYVARVLTRTVNGLRDWPIQRTWTMPVPTVRPCNFEQACLNSMPRAVYEEYIYEYTRKQWGVEPRTLDVELAARIPVRSDDTRLSTATYQALPVHGYTAFVQELLLGVPVSLGVPWQRDRYAGQVVYTGPLDAYHSYALGRLRYRGQRRTLVTVAGEYQPRGQVNNATSAPGIRSIEWKHIWGPGGGTSVVTHEFPCDDVHEYPFPDRENRELAARYKKLSTDAIICGRLGEYKYYDMDQAIARALHIAKGLL